MPYIQCGDGKTYSRASSDPFVKECIEAEHQYYRHLEVIHKNKSFDYMPLTIILTLIIIAIGTGLLTYKTYEYSKHRIKNQRD